MKKVEILNVLCQGNWDTRGIVFRVNQDFLVLSSVVDGNVDVNLTEGHSLISLGIENSV